MGGKASKEKEELCVAMKGCYAGDLAAVRKFLETFPSNINEISDVHEHCLLYGAARNGHNEIIRMLLEPDKYGLKGPAANVDQQCGKSQSTALHAAAYFGKVETAQELRKHNARVDIQNVFGFTAVQEATNEVRQIVFADVPDAFQQASLQRNQNSRGTSSSSSLGEADATSKHNNVTFNVGYISADLKSLERVGDFSRGNVTGAQGDKSALVWRQICMFSLEKFYPPGVTFDVIPEEIQVSWQPKAIGLCCTFAVILSSSTRGKDMRTRISAVKHSLETMVGLQVEDWVNVGMFNGFTLGILGIDVSIQEGCVPNVDEVDLPPPVVRELMGMPHLPTKFPKANSSKNNKHAKRHNLTTEEKTMLPNTKQSQLQPCAQHVDDRAILPETIIDTERSR